MTPCLRPDQFIDVLDGTADAATAAHVVGCAGCQATVAEVRLALAAAVEVEVPEPSPLFWTQMNARVRGALDDARQDSAGGWWGWLRWDVVVPLAGMAMIVVALTSAVGRVPSASDPGRPDDAAELPVDEQMAIGIENHIHRAVLVVPAGGREGPSLCTGHGDPSDATARHWSGVKVTYVFEKRVASLGCESIATKVTKDHTRIEEK